MKFAGSDNYDHIRNPNNNTINIKTRDIEPNNERLGDLMKKMAIMLGELFGED